MADSAKVQATKRAAARAAAAKKMVPELKVHMADTVLSIEDGTGVMPESVTDAAVARAEAEASLSWTANAAERAERAKAEAEAAELRDAVSLARIQERERQAERAQVEMLWKWHTLKTVHPSLAQQIDALWETVHGSRR